MKEFISGFWELFVYVCISGMISNLLAYLIPRNIINAHAFPFNDFRWECEGSIYDALMVRKWKNKVPDLSRYVGFLYTKTLVTRPTSVHVDRLIKESCIAEFVHFVLILTTPLCYFSIDSEYAGLFAVLYAIGNLPFIIIQRYNRPTFKRLYLQLIERESKEISSGGKVHESAHIVM